MSSTKRNQLYEYFHSNTRSQSNIISESNFTYAIILQVINRYVKPQHNVLDIGCGAGTLCTYLAAKGNKVTGIDISKQAIKACKVTSKNLGLEKKTRYMVIDFPNKSLKEKFDIIIFTEVIEHLIDDRLALKKIYNMLNKKGILILSTPSKNAPLFKLGYAKGFDIRVGHLRRYTEEELKVLAEESGLKVIEVIKKEGILRNFLFLNPIAGKLIRLIKLYLVNIVMSFDDILVKLFGESDIFIIAYKK